MTKMPLQMPFPSHAIKKVNRKAREEPQPEGKLTSTPGGRENVTQINVCIANKQMHDKHKEQLPLPQARWSKC